MTIRTPFDYRRLEEVQKISTALLAGMLANPENVKFDGEDLINRSVELADQLMDKIEDMSDIVTNIQIESWKA